MTAERYPDGIPTHGPYFDGRRWLVETDHVFWSDDRYILTHAETYEDPDVAQRPMTATQHENSTRYSRRERCEFIAMRVELAAARRTDPLAGFNSRSV
jgi:hypothetical protein